MIDLNNIKIISGGQSGVDRAALDFCLKNKIKCGGYCPSGRLAEDGRIDDKYPLTELEKDGYAERTVENVLQSELVIVLLKSHADNGTQLAIETARENNIPFMVFSLPTGRDAFEEIRKNIKKYRVINLAGPRESNSPGIYNATLEFLNELFAANL